MRKLSLFSIRSFIGPFIITLAISMFILIMQFFWKYIDDLMGKGIETIYILELLFYVSASLIPLALPLAMLLSSIMTLGNLSENNELTALKSSGLSLYRILRPLTFIILLIAFATFLFANYVIPMANYKWHSLIYDFQNTKIASIIVPGVYTRELDGYAIKVGKVLDDETLLDITIHDRTVTGVLKVVKASKGRIYKSEQGNYLFFNLENGHLFEELNAQTPLFTPEGFLHSNEIRPARRSTFKQAVYKIDLSGFVMSRSEAEQFKDEHEVLTVFQLHDALDSMDRVIGEKKNEFALALEQTHDYFQSENYAKLMDSLKVKHAPSATISPVYFDQQDFSEQELILQMAIQKIEAKQNILAAQKEYIDMLERSVRKYWIEFHRKFALTYAIIILFFVGAPLGAIIRKGGFGAPVVLAALVFMLYFVLNSIGESLVNAQTLSPFWGMWFPSIILTPIAFLLLYAAANDAPLFEKETWKNMIGKRKIKNNDMK